MSRPSATRPGGPGQSRAGVAAGPRDQREWRHRGSAATPLLGAYCPAGIHIAVVHQDLTAVGLLEAHVQVACHLGDGAASSQPPFIRQAERRSPGTARRCRASASQDGIRQHVLMVPLPAPAGPSMVMTGTAAHARVARHSPRSAAEAAGQDRRNPGRRWPRDRIQHARWRHGRAAPR